MSTLAHTYRMPAGEKPGDLPILKPTACWCLRRRRSLTPRQALAGWSLPVLVLLAVGVFSAARGWWWMALFALADIAALVAALWFYARHALDGETLLLDDQGMLHVVQQRGRRRYHTAWQASMVRLEMPEGEPIRLWAGREQLTVGRQAPPYLRELIARELRQALPLAGLHTTR